MRTVSFGFYRVDLDERDGVTPVVDLDAVAQDLPHGSGIDGNYLLHVNRDGSVKVSGDYHAMDDSGYYCGWRRFSFTIRKLRGEESRHDLREPCVGKVQIIGAAGDIVSSPVRGAGADLNDYLDDVFSESLRRYVTGPTYRIEEMEPVRG